MAHIVRIPPIEFINLGSSVGDGKADVNRDDDVFVIRAFMVYLQNFRKDMKFTSKTLATVGGGVDSTLLAMVADYKKFKRNAAEVLLDEREVTANSLIPQDPRLMRGMPRTTILALNMDVRPLKDYGHTAVDVMCSLFPLKPKLDGLPVREDATWQELARSGVPWDKWLRAHKNQAMSDRDIASETLGANRADVKKRPMSPEEAREILDLLQKHQADMKAYFYGRVMLDLASSPNPSRRAQPVTVTATVRTVGGQVPAGKVSIYIVDQALRRSHGQSAIEAIVRNNKRPVGANGTLTVSMELFEGHHTVVADYFDANDVFGARGSIEQHVIP